MNRTNKPDKRQRTTFAFLPATLLMLLPLALVIQVLAQDEAAQVDVTAADRVAATYGVSNFASHPLPPKTLAGRTASARNLGRAGTLTGTGVGVVAATTLRYRLPASTGRT